MVPVATGIADYSYDGVGNRTSITDANNHGQAFTYDAVGHATLVAQPNGVINRYVYDQANRLTGIDLGNTGGTPAIQYGYDPANRRTSLVDGTGTTSYAYDSANRLTSITAPLTGQVQYGYDNANERTSLTYSSGHQVSYTYTTRGQLATAKDWLSNTASYTYDAGGRLTQLALPNGVTTTETYDNADRLLTVSHVKKKTSLESITYTVNAVGVRTKMTDSAGTTTWGYDNLDRLTSAGYPNGDSASYAYDPVGNRTSLTFNGTTTTSTYDQADRLTAAGSTSYTYDNNGNQRTKVAGGVTTTYAYDQLNRLTGVSGPISASYNYNGDGRRVSKTVSGTTTNFTWDQTGVGVVLGDGNEYVWGSGLISQITSAGTTTYAHSDGLGSVRLLTSGTGALAGKEQYDAYGAPRSPSGVQLPFTYTGEQVDQEAGFVYLRARYLDPSTGRFLTRDPLPSTPTEPRSFHRFIYAQDDPTLFTDPSGLIIYFVHGTFDNPQPEEKENFTSRLFAATGQRVVDFHPNLLGETPH
jgi:RHS repeat-associated protein